MKTILIDDKKFEYVNCDIQLSFGSHVTLHLTLPAQSIDRDFIFKKWDQQTSYNKNYKFNIRTTKGTFYGCSMKSLNYDDKYFKIDILADHHDAKDIQQHRKEVIENLLSDD